jgi:hypothetical protein
MATALVKFVKDGVGESKFSDADFREMVTPLVPKGFDSKEQMEVNKQRILDMIRNNVGDKPILNAFRLNPYMNPIKETKRPE